MWGSDGSDCYPQGDAIDEEREVCGAVVMFKNEKLKDWVLHYVMLFLNQNLKEQAILFGYPVLNTQAHVVCSSR